eukprot:353311-Chlamydomonas_euryale.AAC.3
MKKANPNHHQGPWALRRPLVGGSPDCVGIHTSMHLPRSYPPKVRASSIHVNAQNAEHCGPILESRRGGMCCPGGMACAALPHLT